MVVTNENKNEYIEWEHSHISNSLVVSFNQKKKRDFFLKCALLFSVSLSSRSLVIQWRFVNRVQKQMNAFLEVVIVATWGQYKPSRQQFFWLI